MRSINSMKPCMMNIIFMPLLQRTCLVVLIVLSYIPLYSTNAFALRAFYIERPRLGLDLSYEYENDSRTGPFTEVDNTSKTFTEKLEIQTMGWVYHPALLIYSLEFLPEWKQRTQTTISGDKRTTNPELQGYLAQFTIFQYKPYTLILTANRDSTTTRNNFAERSDTETDTYSARLILKYNILPTNISYFHVDGTKSGFYDAENTKDQVLFNMRHDKYLGRTIIDGSYTDTYDDTKGSVIESNQFKTGLNNTYYFTETKDGVLNSVFNYDEYDSTNNISKRYDIFENLHWLHSYNLSTNYNLRYDKNNAYDKLNNKSLSTETRSAGFNLTHLLYENLKTNFDLDARENNSVGGRNNIYGARVDFNYTRRIPWGTLNLLTGFDYRIFDNRPRTDFMTVTNEAVILHEGLTTYLTQDNINPESIVVKDENGHILQKDIDYTISERGSLVGIKPVLGAGLDDTTVYVDYEFRNPTYDYSTFGQNYGITLSLWKIWRLYYLISHSRQHLISGVPDEDLLDDSSHKAGTEVEWKWSRTAFEWEDQYSTSVPQRKWRFDENLRFRPGDRSFITFSANYGETRFKDTMDIDKNLGFKSGLQRLIGERGFLDMSAFFDRVSGSTDRIITKGLTSSYEWSYLIWTIRISYEYRNIDDEIARETSNNNYFLFNINRTLF